MEEEAIPVAPPPKMPTLRLQDVLHNLEKKSPTVLNLDACLPDGCPGEVLGYILSKTSPSLHTLSLRFNTLSDDIVAVLIEWLDTNTYLEVLYLMGTKISNSSRQAIETSFKKNLVAHSSNNMGFTLNRLKR
jgi:hypothetical protein